MVNNHDLIISKILWNQKNNQGSKLYRRFNQKSSKYINIFNYLNNRYKDSESIYESLLRIVYNITERPVCPICGNKLKFIGKPNNKGIFQKTCSLSCSNKLTNNFNKHIKESQEKTKKTKLEKYGNLNNIQKIQQTKLERYGNEYYNNKEKANQTKLKRYGNQNYNNREKYHQTCLEKYGIETFVNPLKGKETKLERYGDENYNNNEQIKLTYQLKPNKEKQESINKGKYTKLVKYGDENYNNKEKSKQTCLERYGNISWTSSNKGKEILSKILSLPNIREKINKTKTKNKTHNTSNPEDQCFELLKEKYPDVKRQYISDVYPFNCDFYIPSLDLYIEYNEFWTHGNHPYNPTNIEDQQKLQKWKSKNTKFFLNAIETWTTRDIKKRNTAKQNNLNYIEFWNMNEVKKWIINQY